MSSELAGEIGQAGLAIGSESKMDSDEGAPLYGGKEEEAEEGGGTMTGLGNGKRGCQRRTSANRPKRFRQAWMMYDIFKEWLRPHALPEFATCIACNRVIKAGKSELEKHAVGKKHLRMLKTTSTPQPPPVLLLGQRMTSHDLCVRTSPLFDESGYSGSESKEVEICNDHREFSDCTGEGGSQQRVAVDQEQTAGVQSPPSISSGISLSFSSSPFSPTNNITSFSNQLTMNTQPHRLPDVQYVSKAFVTKPAPPWKATAIVNGHVTKLDLSDYKGRYLILFFYPQDFSKLCASEVNILSDRINEFRANCTEIVACSVDSHLSHLAWSKTPRSEGGIGHPKIPIIADPTHSITKDYGVFMPDKGHSLRAHFIIDRRGILRHMSVNDVGVGRGTDELMRIVKALQFIDENEEVCLADWKPIDE